MFEKALLIEKLKGQGRKNCFLGSFSYYLLWWIMKLSHVRLQRSFLFEKIYETTFMFLSLICFCRDKFSWKWSAFCLFWNIFCIISAVKSFNFSKNGERELGVTLMIIELRWKSMASSSFVGNYKFFSISRSLFWGLKNVTFPCMYMVFYTSK